MSPGAAITIRRPRQLVDRPMSYTVWIDGQAVGSVYDGEHQRFGVTPGTHQIRLGISGKVLGNGRIWTSQDALVETKPGDVAFLTCSPKPLKGMIRPRHRLDLSKAVTVR